MTAVTQIEAINIVDAASQPALARLFQRVGQLTPLPTAAHRITQLAADQSSNATDLLDVVEGDPVLAAKVLRRVNSAFYGLRNRVTDLRSAISLLGFREIRNLALTVYLARIFDNGSSYRGFSRDGLWHHCVCVAQAARLISKARRRENSGETYLAGLLHDLGLILLDQFLQKHLYKIIDLVDGGAGTPEAEATVLPFDHAQLGAFVAMQWNFPTGVVAAIRYHHDPQAAPSDHRETTSTVSVANYLCHRAGVTSLGVQNIFTPPDDVFAQLQLEPAQLASVWDQLQEALRGTPLS